MKKVLYCLLGIAVILVLVFFARQLWYWNITQELKSAVVNDFVDPESARFRNVRLQYMEAIDEFPREIFLCGEVNAKNRMGAYTGYRWFYVSQEKKAASFMGDGYGENWLIENICFPTRNDYLYKE